MAGNTLSVLMAERIAEDAIPSNGRILGFGNGHRSGPLFVCVECGGHSIPLLSEQDRRAHYESDGHKNAVLSTASLSDRRRWDTYTKGAVKES